MSRKVVGNFHIFGGNVERYRQVIETPLSLLEYMG